MKIIGVTGPSGAGKTTVLRALEARGCLCVDCDALYHELLDTSPELLSELTEQFGWGILSQQGQLDRKALGKIVFSSPQALSRLNAITHPYVMAACEEIAEVAAQEGCPAVVFDAVALLECGMGDWCDATIAVTAPEEVRVARIMARDGIPEAQARARVAAQRDSSFYVNCCDHSIVNDGSLSYQALDACVGKLLEIILC